MTDFDGYTIKPAPVSQEEMIQILSDSSVMVMHPDEGMIGIRITDFLIYMAVRLAADGLMQVPDALRAEMEAVLRGDEPLH